VSDDQLKWSRAVLKKHGNMSSASVLFVLEEVMASGAAQPGEWGIITAFGAGFSAFASLVKF
jgi:alkylresorcinol/alkylpyrone synthase